MVDPDSLFERRGTADPEDLKMLDHPEEKDETTVELGKKGDIDPELLERFDL